MLACVILQTGPSRLEQILASATASPEALAAGLGLAFFLGAAHALTPGHGKAIVAAYLAGTQGRITDAIYLGGVVTLTHTASVFVLGFLALFASRQVALDRIYPWLSLLSGVLVTGIGIGLLWSRGRGGGHSHGHGHVHPHSHGGDHDSHEHEHEHGHSHTGGHTHAPQKHAHPGGSERGSLLSLGVSGGLVPCPEALVVLMLAISLRQLALGLAILAAFSLGLAVVLVGIGCAMVLAGPAVKKLTGPGKWTLRLPRISAAVVAALGVAMIAQSVQRLL